MRSEQEEVAELISQQKLNNMEIYSPKKFRPNDGQRNEYRPTVYREARRDESNEIRSGEKDKTQESLAERMKRIFYERLRAFFEYEEVS